MAYDALLLDHDGVVVTTLECERRERAFREHATSFFTATGLTDPPESLLTELNDGLTSERVRELAERHGYDPAELWQCRDDAMKRTLLDAVETGDKRPYPDVEALEPLSRPRGLVSNNQRRIIEAILEEYACGSLFQTIQARDPTIESLDRKKPDPTLLACAMADLGVTEPLFVGDRASDVVAANRVGVDVAYIRREHNAETTLSVEPAYEVGSLHEVAGLLD